jgi:(1->4)-alpha-D-glucan 1-alpha-D-glucosylmutase
MPRPAWEERSAAPLTVPGSTWRFQLNSEFTFKHAAAALPYLSELGITDLYLSPIFTAGRNSTHGYDVSNFQEINPALGGEAGLEALLAAARSSGMGVLLDIVPNHMGAALSNPWWVDVLEKGRDSSFANWFDIDWDSANPRLNGKVALPLLEDRYAKVLEAGKLKVTFKAGKFFVTYYENEFPMSEAGTKTVVETARNVLGLSADQPPELSEAQIVSALYQINGQAGAAQSFDSLHKILEKQHYRLTYWQTGISELNYRRFFDVSSLVALRMELPQVFEAAHGLVQRLLREGKITGLRVDHPDGLWNPQEYFERLQRTAIGQATPAEKPVYVVAEKILSGDETLPPDWAVSGTTGYEFLNQLNGLFVDSKNAGIFDHIYQDFTGRAQHADEVIYSNKHEVLRRSFQPEIESLARLLQTIALQEREGQDFTIGELKEGLIELVTCFPIYRTYVTEKTFQPALFEKECIERACQAAKNRNPPGASADVLDFVRSVLLLHQAETAGPQFAERCRQFVLRFQQLTGPAMAKGLEDTAFYRFNRLISLNEVGGEPGTFGRSVDQFHAHNLRTAKRWPHTLLATATHDTKRGEDARLRIDVLSEIPGKWKDALVRWRNLNAAAKTIVKGRPAPGANDEYFLYQSLVGAWPGLPNSGEELKSFAKRVQAYMQKALREAKVHTSWISPDEAYETAVRQFIDEILNHSVFLKDFTRFHNEIDYFAHLNSLSQVLLKMTSPGVPDFYQGCDLFDYSFVDPDNRRPLGYEERIRLLNEVKTEAVGPRDDLATVFQRWLNTNPQKLKQILIWKGLHVRNENKDLFAHGQYVPLKVSGRVARHVCAFARVWNGKTAIVIAGRLFHELNNGAPFIPTGQNSWGAAVAQLPDEIADNRFTDKLTETRIHTQPMANGSCLRLSEVFQALPVGLLLND